VVLIRTFGKLLQSNEHSTLKMHSDDRDSDVRDGFIGAHEDKGRECTLDANVQDVKLTNQFSLLLLRDRLPFPAVLIQQNVTKFERR
jgi:hypothetical protein